MVKRAKSEKLKSEKRGGGLHCYDSVTGCTFDAFAVPFARLVQPYLGERSKIMHLTTCAGASEASAARPRYRGYCD